MNQWLARARRYIQQDERGFGLVETMVAVGILAVAATYFVATISTGVFAVQEQGQEVVAQRLVRNQLEYVKELPYDEQATTYPSVDVPAGYALSTDVSPIPSCGPGIQQITVTVSQGGEDILIVQNYKAER